MKNKVTLPKSHRANQKQVVEGYCANCYEFSIFRAVKINNKKNNLACVICLASKPLPNSQPVKYNALIMQREPNAREVFKRQLRRSKEFFTGNIVYLPFKIKRRSKLGINITMLIIKLKGLKNA